VQDQQFKERHQFLMAILEATNLFHAYTGSQFLPVLRFRVSLSADLIKDFILLLKGIQDPDLG